MPTPNKTCPKCGQLASLRIHVIARFEDQPGSPSIASSRCDHEFHDIADAHASQVVSATPDEARARATAADLVAELDELAAFDAHYGEIGGELSGLVASDVVHWRTERVDMNMELGKIRAALVERGYLARRLIKILGVEVVALGAQIDPPTSLASKVANAEAAAPLEA